MSKGGWDMPDSSLTRLCCGFFSKFPLTSPKALSASDAFWFGFWWSKSLLVATKGVPNFRQWLPPSLSYHLKVVTQITVQIWGRKSWPFWSQVLHIHDPFCDLLCLSVCFWKASLSRSVFEAPTKLRRRSRWSGFLKRDPQTSVRVREAVGKDWTRWPHPEELPCLSCSACLSLCLKGPSVCSHCLTLSETRLVWGTVSLLQNDSLPVCSTWRCWKQPPCTPSDSFLGIKKNKLVEER